MPAKAAISGDEVPPSFRERDVRKSRPSSGRGELGLTVTEFAISSLRVVKRFLTIALLIGAMTGLFGQVVALAHIPPAPVEHAQEMSDECMAMMAAAEKDGREAPCKGLTLDCVAAMGCTVSMTVPEPVTIAGVLPMHRPSPAIGKAQPLAARVIAPEPEPPSLI
jgi:hypothetical protein